MSETVQIKVTRGSDTLAQLEADCFHYEISSNGNYAMVALKLGQSRGAAEQAKLLDLIFQSVREVIEKLAPPPGKQRAVPRFEPGDEIFLEVGEHNMVTEHVGTDDQRIGEPIPDDLIVWRAEA